MISEGLPDAAAQESLTQRSSAASRWSAVPLALAVFASVAAIIVVIQCNDFEFFSPGEFGIEGALKALVFLGLPLGAFAAAGIVYLRAKMLLPNWAAWLIGLIAVLSSLTLFALS